MSRYEIRIIMNFLSFRSLLQNSWYKLFFYQFQVGSLSFLLVAVRCNNSFPIGISTFFTSVRYLSTSSFARKFIYPREASPAVALQKCSIHATYLLFIRFISFSWLMLDHCSDDFKVVDFFIVFYKQYNL